MILIDATTMWKCETCYWHGNTGCASSVWCENGESYRPSIDKLKQVNAEPVRHGHWKYFHKQNKAVCTNCSFERDIDVDFGRAISCPNCGAKMDGKEKNND